MKKYGWIMFISILIAALFDSEELREQAFS